jgi:amidohydrolase
MRTYSPSDVARLKATAAAAIDEYRDRLTDMSRTIHDHPEVAFEEFETSKRLTEALRSWTQAEVQLGVAGLPTAFKATMDTGRPGPTVAFVAEYDALPNLGHGCGHNLICSIAVASAVGIQAILPELNGRIQVIGTPAEEGGGGKVIMIEDGAFEGVDACLMIHPLDECKIDTRLLALCHLTIEFHGRAAHASDKNNTGINALYALLMTFQGINNLRETFISTDRVHGVITHGGERPNIVPAYSRGEFYVRAATQPRVEQILERVQNCARGAALATGATVEFPPLKRSLMASRFNSPIKECFGDNLAAQGFDVDRGVREPEGASNDFSNVSQIIPSSEVTVPIGPLGLHAHTREFVEAAATDTAWDALIRGAKAEAGTAIALLTDPELFERVRAEFAKGQ